ncbi:prolyl oligopeptidase family serine peptidase [Novosphingobium sp.]|uniref:alpha/beta hydrolase family protein n=1 Tax=Novosphingobium sp. TaxID=1874826 RepID=UPI001D9BC43E|nr:prolyl oligopeptidase family serine peptidase [Novosphingobium sp.]MBX9665508.1 prolyl oligopeptidase family serine peptidase [Novosphingobium sp.]
MTIGLNCRSRMRTALRMLTAFLLALVPVAVLAADPPAPVAATPTAALKADGSPALIPTTVLGKLPFISGPKLSPDGLHLAAFVTVANRTVVGIFDLATGSNKLLNAGEKLDMRWFRWAGNDRLLVSIGKMVPWFGEDALQTRLVVHQISTDTMRFIGGKEEGLDGDDILWVDPEGKSILLSYQKTIYDYPSVSSIDLANNRSKTVVTPRADLWDWYADEKGVVRAGLIFSDNTWKMIYREKDGDSFRTVMKADIKDREAGCIFYRIYQATDEGYCIMRNDTTGRDALYRYNFATRQRGNLVFEVPDVNVDDFDTKFDSPELLAAWYTDNRPRAHWFDPGIAEIQLNIDKAVTSAMGDRSAEIVSYSRDRSRMLVHVGGSGDPGRYYVFDLSDSTMKLFAQSNEKLKPAQLVTTTYTRYKARDGLELPAYITMPPGRAAKNLPLVILPHGGPYDVRDEGTYDAEVQFLANRGYVVLQPQYRGSGGYGEAFDNKGAGQWGRAMQDDLDDGMDWLAKQGTIDSKRVCIIGSSYGGYAAMWGAIRNPERYRCAASFAGVSDLKRQLKYSNKFFRSQRYKDDWRRTVQGEDTFDLATVSPLLTVDKLQVPLLLVHGDDDQRVPYKQSKLMADALTKAGKNFEFITLKGEGHGFSSDANMQLWLDKLDAFLAKYNPAP